MSKAELSPEAAKILQARRDAVSELKERDGKERAIHDPYVTRLAFARMYQQTIMAQMAAGEHVSASDYAAADAAVENALAAVPLPPLKFELEIVKSDDAAPPGEGVSGCVECWRCRWRLAPGEHYSRCPKCAWKEGDDLMRPAPDDDGSDPFGGGIGGGDDGASEPMPEPATAARGVHGRLGLVRRGAIIGLENKPVIGAPELGLKNKPSVPAPAPESRGVKNTPQVAQAPRRKSNSELHKQMHCGGYLRADQVVSDANAPSLVQLQFAHYGHLPVDPHTGQKWPNPVRHGGPYGV